MAQYKTLQKQRTITGNTTSGSYAETQPLEEFADVSGWGGQMGRCRTRVDRNSL